MLDLPFWQGALSHVGYASIYTDFENEICITRGHPVVPVWRFNSSGIWHRPETWNGPEDPPSSRPPESNERV